jgi:hypothetical protein
MFPRRAVCYLAISCKLTQPACPGKLYRNHVGKLPYRAYGTGG